MHQIHKRALPVAALTLVALPLIGVAPAHAATNDTFSANLTALNGSGAHSKVVGKLSGDTLWITVTSSGLSAGLPHAAHLHIGGTNSCPAPTQRGTGVDGHLRVKDGAASYGSIAVSLTTSGDTSPKSALAVDRFPVGNTTYTRNIPISATIAGEIRAGKAVVVQHGVDYNKSGKYDGASKSELNATLPEEATDPATCGRLEVSQLSGIPNRGPQTGNGSTMGMQHAGALGAGAAAIAVGGVGLIALKRRTPAARR